MSKHSKHPKHVHPRTCDDRCDHFCYIGDGDAVCNKTMPPKTVMEDWTLTDNFRWCGGKEERS